MPPNTSFACQTCDMPFSSEGELELHLQQKYPDI